jgi:hypothetical protein
MGRVSWVRTLRAQAAIIGVALLLSACAAHPLAPTEPVPQPPPETAAMQAQIRSQISTLQGMACFSAAAYAIEPDPRADGHYFYNPEHDHYKETCAHWTEAPNTVIQAFPVSLTDDSGRPYVGVFMVWTDDLHKRQVVAMRGTDNLQDWEANLHFRPVADEILKVSVHEGFNKYARAVYGSLTKGHPGTLKADYDTFFTGHSLGGAVAVLVGLYFYVEESQRYKFKGTYTFGQPRVFDTRGTTSWPDYARNTYRVETCYDPVPLVPIGDSLVHSLVVGPLWADTERRQYQHLGRGILLLNRGTYWMPGENEVVRNLISDLQVIFQTLQGHYQNDHYIGTYISRLSDLAGAGGRPPTPVNPAFDFVHKCLPYYLDTETETASAGK